MTVLAATDFSDPSRHALQIAGREARLRGEALMVVHSVELEGEHSMWWNVFETDRIVPERLHENARRRLETFVREQLPPSRRPQRTFYHTDIDSPVETIRQVAERVDPSLLAIGATGRGALESTVVGSTAEELIRSAPVPVITADGAEAGPFETVLAPTDFSECSSHGLAEAIEVARREEGRLIVLHEAVMQSPGFGRPAFGPTDGVKSSHRREIRARLSDYLSQFDLTDIDYETTAYAQDYDTHTPAETIVSEAERRGADLIVMGTHGRRGFKRFLMGSTTLKVLHRKPCCLMTVCAKHRVGEDAD